MDMNELPRKVRRQVERHLAKQQRKELVRQHNLTFEAEKFFDTDEGKEYYNELIKLYIDNQKTV